MTEVFTFDAYPGNSRAFEGRNMSDHQQQPKAAGRFQTLAGHATGRYSPPAVSTPRVR